MLLIVEKRIRGEMCHSINRYAKAINKYTTDYDKNKDSSYVKYWDVNLYGLAMSRKLPVDGFQQIEDAFQINEDFIKSYNEESDEGYFLEVYVQYLENLHKTQNDPPILPQRMKIEKVEKLVTNLHVKSEYIINIRNLKQALNHGQVVIKKVNNVTNFNQRALLKQYINLNTFLRKVAKSDFKKDFFKLMNNSVLEKLWKMLENIEILNI